jgi:uroporphyrinogen-III decarboxylase
MLIDEIGHNGGLILRAGCSVPYAVKPENFKAMLDTGKNYELFRE